MNSSATTDQRPGGPNGPRILLLSGVNLGLLGRRQPEVYGTETLEDHVTRARAVAGDYGATIDHVSSDAESVIVGAIADARDSQDAIIINPGAFTHYSWAIHDALAAFEGPVIELHLSNPGGREPWRHTSVVTPVASAVIAGLGGMGYELAVRGVVDLLRR